MLQILYHKRHVYKTLQVVMDEKPNKIHKNLIPTKTKQPYCTVLIHVRITIRITSIPYNWPAGFLIE